MDMIKAKLIEAENIALRLFTAIEEHHMIKAGKSEIELNEGIFKLADELFGIRKFWHKRIVRCGVNTLVPYDENPPNLILKEDDILFIDFGSIIEEWEADFGRTYVLGGDPLKHKLKADIELAWHDAKNWFHTQTRLTGAEFHHSRARLSIREPHKSTFHS
jgi:Xaa-Pro aminopeptidase